MVQVIERSNSNEYGLAAGVWTKNLNWMNSLSRGVQSGTIWVNCYDVFDAAVPFGGYKLSGIGREHGDEVLGHYTQVRYWCPHHCHVDSPAHNVFLLWSSLQLADFAP